MESDEQILQQLQNAIMSKGYELVEEIEDVDNKEPVEPVLPVEQPEEPKKRRGRPPKPKPVRVPKANGRPRLYPEGARDHHRQHIKVPKDRYKELISIEKKYKELLNAQNI